MFVLKVKQLPYSGEDVVRKKLKERIRQRYSTYYRQIMQSLLGRTLLALISSEVAIVTPLPVNACLSSFYINIVRRLFRVASSFFELSSRFRCVKELDGTTAKNFIARKNFIDNQFMIIKIPIPANTCIT